MACDMSVHSFLRMSLIDTAFSGECFCCLNHIRIIFFLGNRCKTQNESGRYGITALFTVF
jgi:hypothetical protein